MKITKDHIKESIQENPVLVEVYGGSFGSGYMVVVGKKKYPNWKKYKEANQKELQAIHDRGLTSLFDLEKEIKQEPNENE